MLRGATRLLSHKHIAWQIEFSPRLLEQAGSSSAHVIDLAEAHFTHFIDLGARVTPRSKPISLIRQAVESLERRERRQFAQQRRTAGRRAAQFFEQQRLPLRAAFHHRRTMLRARAQPRMGGRRRREVFFRLPVSPVEGA